MRRIECTVPDCLEGRTVAEVARREMRMSRHALTRAKFCDDGILLDGARVRTNMRVFAGQRLSIVVGDAAEASEAGRVAPIAGSVCIAYEDDDLIILDKPAGIVMYPYEGIGEPTLGNYLMHYLMESAECDGGEAGRLHPVHRLDRGTSGLVVFAKNAHAQHILQKALHAESFCREYLAVCHGILPEEGGVIDAPIARKAYRPASFCVRDDGKPARTHFRVLRTWMAGSTCARGASASLVRLRLETGRTHQIRVHLSSVGCPLLGDELYGGSVEAISRPALHSENISMEHPITGERIVIRAPLPDDMKNVLRSLGR